MSYGILFNFKPVLFYKTAVCSKVFISFYYIYKHLHLQYYFFLVFISAKFRFDLSKVKDSKTYQQRNRQLFSSSRTHSISVKFIKVTYITISNNIRSYVCPKCYQRQNTIGP